MPRGSLTGTLIRARRALHGMRQADLARLIGVSPSYLNLIEHNRRRVSPALMEQIARALGVSQDTLTESTDTRLVDNARAAAERAGTALDELERIDEFIGRFPGWARVLADTQARVEGLEHVVDQLNDRMTHDPYLGEALHEIISAVTSVQSTAAILNDGDIAADWQARFHGNILQDSTRLAEGAVALVNYIDTAKSTETGLAAPQEEVEAWLDARNHDLTGLESLAEQELDRLLAGAPELSSDASRALARHWVGRICDDLRALPDAALTAALESDGLTPDILAQNLNLPLDLILRRIGLMSSTLIAQTGIPQPGLAICDLSGTLVLRRAVEGFPFPRFGGGCPLWPIYQVLLQPFMPLRVPMMTAGRLGRGFIGFACAFSLSRPAFDFPPTMQGTMLIVPQPTLPKNALSVGATCRICAQQACPSRREQSILSIP